MKPYDPLPNFDFADDPYPSDPPRARARFISPFGWCVLATPLVVAALYFAIAGAVIRW